MRKIGSRVLMGSAAVLAAIGLAAPAWAKPPRAPAPAVAAAVADPARPAADRARDGARRPAEMLAFAQVHPGMKVGELLPGGGYFTRIFAKAVGPRGIVYAWLPSALPAKYADPFLPVAKAYPNVRLARGDAFAAPEPLDLVWTSQNYHDLYLGGGTAEATNAAVFAALKPGGTYVVVDHRAASGTGVSAAGTLHRIEEAAVIAGVLKAGFVFDGEDMSLRRADDDHTLPVFKLHDATDQMVLRFRKPTR